MIGAAVIDNIISLSILSIVINSNKCSCWVGPNNIKISNCHSICIVNVIFWRKNINLDT